MPKLEVYTLTIARIIIAITKTGKYKHTELTGKNFSEFASDYKDFPEIIKEFWPQNLFYFYGEFIEYLELEISIFNQSKYNFFDTYSFDKYNLKKKLEALLPTEDELLFLTNEKEKSYMYDPDYPTHIDLVKGRARKASLEYFAKQKEIFNSKIKLNNLTMSLDNNNNGVYYYNRVLFNGTAYEYEDNNSQNLIKISKEFVNGKLDGEVIEWRKFIERKVRAITGDFIVYGQYKFIIKTYKEGKLISENFYDKNGKERSKPFLYKLFD